MLGRIASALCVALVAGALAAPLAAQQPSKPPETAQPTPAEMLAAIERLTAVVEAQRRELVAQRDLLERQRAQLERIEQRLAAPATGTATLSSVATTPLETTTLAAASQQAAAEPREAPVVPPFGPLRFSGDLRLRYEPFFQPGTPDRHRFRVRARLNGTAELSPELRAGFTLATGQLSDVNSTNQSLTDFFTRKAVGFDRYWVSYRPRGAKGLELTGGKFGVPWASTPLTFDNDVSIEGFAQRFARETDGPLRSFSATGFQLPIRESSSGPDSFLAGAQMGVEFGVGERGAVGFHATGLNFVRADAIARGLGADIRPSLPNSNLLVRDTEGNVTGYASRFLLVDLLASARYRFTERWPLVAQFNFVRNTRAVDSESDGYWAELTLGRLAQPGDVQFDYAFMRIERDAVLAAFNESDLRAGTNVLNHRFQFRYRAAPRVSLEYTYLLGRLARPELTPDLVPASRRAGCLLVPAVNCRDPYLKRMQVDAVLRF